MRKTHDGSFAKATDPNGPTGRLATWLANLKFEDVPPQVLERAKHLILDGLASAIVGARLPWSVTAVEAVLSRLLSLFFRFQL